MTETNKNDPVNHPAHYNGHPSGVECITVVEHMGFCIGNAVKYLWRAGQKGDALQDLKKARWYVDREIARLEGKSVGSVGAQCCFHVVGADWLCIWCKQRPLSLTNRVPEPRVCTGKVGSDGPVA